MCCSVAKRNEFFGPCLTFFMCSGFCPLHSFMIPAGNINTHTNIDEDECRERCDNRAACIMYDYVIADRNCYLKRQAGSFLTPRMYGVGRVGTNLCGKNTSTSRVGARVGFGYAVDHCAQGSNTASNHHENVSVYHSPVAL